VLTDVDILRVESFSLFSRVDTPAQLLEISLQLVSIVNVTKFVKIWKIGVLTFKTLVFFEIYSCRDNRMHFLVVLGANPLPF
jgi:hypothetical protein